jgi:hypothetical protein
MCSRCTRPRRGPGPEKIHAHLGRAVARTMASVRFNPTARRYPRTNKTGRNVNPSSFLTLTRFSSLHRTEQASTNNQRASAAASPLSVARAHRWVDAPALSGITVWLTDSTSLSVVKGPSPSSSRMMVVAWASTGNNGDLCHQPLVASSRTAAQICYRRWSLGGSPEVLPPPSRSPTSMMRLDPVRR